MNITDIKLISGHITKLDFGETDNDLTNSTTGFLLVNLVREERADVSDNALTLFFSGDIAAYRGEETSAPDEALKAFFYKMEFSLTYHGVFDVESISGWLDENEACFKKDSSVFFSSKSTSILSETNFKNINIPYQQ